jgi:putative transposase
LVGQKTVDLDFFQQTLQHVAEERQQSGAWRDGVYTVIQAMMASGLQGVIGIEGMCRLADVSRAGYYRHWQASSPRREEAGLRDAIQRLALSNPHYDHRRTVMLGRESWQANHKRALRLMREDDLLCLRKAGLVPMTTDSRHGWRVVPNLARGLQLTDIDQFWVADITYVHLAGEFAYLNWPPFRPDSRPNAGGLGISSSTGLWLTTIDGLN